MLFQLRKKNIELNDEYNKLVNEKTRLKIEYQRMKKRVKKFEKEKIFENRESLEMFVESIQNISNVNDSIIISKKLLDSSIFIDEKDSNIEN